MNSSSSSEKWKEAGEERDLGGEDKDVESVRGGREKVDQLDNSCCPPAVHDVVLLGDERGEHLEDGEGEVGRVADDKDNNQTDQYVNHCSIPN